MSIAQPQSIHDLPPLEVGGVANRKGIAFQDHVAAGFCIEMLFKEKLTAVWCETQDDITRFAKSKKGVEHVEFVQVKANEGDQLWKISAITSRTKGTLGTSILERSLANDRCSEPTRFRIITARPVHSELKPLTLEPKAPGRQPTHADFAKLQSEIAARVGSFKSPNGHDCAFWIANTQWDERHSLDAVRKHNLLDLHKYAQQQNYHLLSDQITAVYDKILQLIWEAGKADWKANPDSKKLTRQDFIAVVNRFLLETTPSHVAGTALKNKMQNASIPPETISAAEEMRRRYRKTAITPSYLVEHDKERLEAAILARLQVLKSELDQGCLESGQEFHGKCLSIISSIVEELGFGSSEFGFAQGFMYHLTDRCAHRFGRAVI